MSNKNLLNPSKERLKIETIKRVRVRIISDPYVVFTWAGYAAVVDIAVRKKTFRLFIGSRTLAEGVEKLRTANGGKFLGLEFTVRRESDSKRSAYVVQ
jgi:hypothetical protein